MRSVYDDLCKEELVPVEPKLAYVINYVAHDMLTPASGRLLAQQLGCHIQDLTTMKEADLISGMNERVFVSTVHKAKGLEFDSVIVFDAVDGKYPSAYANTKQEGDAEEARKFYVAISRARRRLIISYCRQSISRWGRWFDARVTPYLDCIKSLF